MFDADDPLDESEGPGQPNFDLEKAGDGDQVDSAVGTRNGTAAVSLTAGMLLGPRLTLERRRQRVREWVCAPLTCPGCVCGVCCASSFKLDLCGTDCHLTCTAGRASSDWESAASSDDNAD